MEKLLHKSWNRACSKLFHNIDNKIDDQLIICYNEPQRKYHNLEHLKDCIENFEQVSHFAKYPEEIELALWFHDAVYNVKSLKHGDNEKKSAEWAKKVALSQNVSNEIADRIYNLIMATGHNEHKEMPPTQDEMLMIDIDLAILGADQERFDKYEKQIREEYSWVPNWLYSLKRKNLLRLFLNKSSIYNTSYFKDNYELKARKNLSKYIAEK